MREPNYFVVGAPKCGTTALHNYLKEHPQVFAPWAKEPHFFAEDLPGRRDFQRYDDYLKLFKASKPEQTAIGESSIFYLYSDVAIANILERRPNARLIAMLRNPIEMIPTMHAQWLFGLYEDIPDVATAWRMQDARARGESIPRFCQEPRVLQYRAVASLGTQLERFFTLVPPQQRMTILYDDFARDTAGVYRQVLAFLGLPDDGRTEFPRVNPQRKIRWPWLQQALFHRRLPKSVRLIGRHLGIHKLQRKLWKWNAVPTKKEALPAALWEELRYAFEREIELMSSLLKRDLSAWLTRN